jgi:hypothetical protein
MVVPADLTSIPPVFHPTPEVSEQVCTRNSVALLLSVSVCTQYTLIRNHNTSLMQCFVSYRNRWQIRSKYLFSPDDHRVADTNGL